MANCLLLTNEKETQSDSRKFKGELAHQHYKLLEQVSDEDYKFRGLTKTEEIITLWFSSSSTYLCWIFLESIKEIRVKEKDEPTIAFHFRNELKEKEISS